MSWAQPGRRDVDHMLARKGVIPVNRTSRRLYGSRSVGLGSQSGITEADSVKSLCVNAVSAIHGLVFIKTFHLAKGLKHLLPRKGNRDVTYR